MSNHEAVSASGQKEQAAPRCEMRKKTLGAPCTHGASQDHIVWPPGSLAIQFWVTL